MWRKKISRLKSRSIKCMTTSYDPDYVNDSLSELQEKILEMKNRSRRNNIVVDVVIEEIKKKERRGKTVK